MSHTIILHIKNSEPVLAEIDEMPDPKDRMLKVTNPRQRDGKDLIYLEHNVVTVYFPIAEINFIELLPGEDEEEVISFVRE